MPTPHLVHEYTSVPDVVMVIWEWGCVCVVRDRWSFLALVKRNHSATARVFSSS